MQNRIDNKFLELKEINRKALVAFVTSGDPNQKISKNILNVLRDKKIDLIEIGFPFSDPMADGPTIQKSSQRAIKAGANIDSTFELVKDFRKNDENIPGIHCGPSSRNIFGGRVLFRKISGPMFGGLGFFPVFFRAHFWGPWGLVKAG